MLGAHLSEGVEEVRLLVVLMVEEEEVRGPGPEVVAAEGHHHLSGSVWLSLALTSVDFEDAVCTKAAAAPVKVRTCRLLWRMSVACWALWFWEQRRSPVFSLRGAPAEEGPAGTRSGSVAAEAACDPAGERGALSAEEHRGPPG